MLLIVTSDINECASNATNPCQQDCTNNEAGGFNCSCREGFNQKDFLCEGQSSNNYITHQ